MTHSSQQGEGGFPGAPVSHPGASLKVPKGYLAERPCGAGGTHQSHRGIWAEQTGVRALSRESQAESSAGRSGETRWCRGPGAAGAGASEVNVSTPSATLFGVGLPCTQRKSRTPWEPPPPLPQFKTKRAPRNPPYVRTFYMTPVLLDTS